MLSIVCSNPDHHALIQTVIDGYGPAFRGWLDADGTKIVVLEPHEKYSDLSPGLRRLASGVDAWPVPPAGLFVVEEATVYLRSVTRMTIAHEVMHAYDHARGGGVYLSGVDASIRSMFQTARQFVTPYAASGLDEYFAEAGRACHGDGNDPRSNWPRATPERLEEIDPRMFAFMRRLLRESAPSDTAIAA
jgi:hypothetical protein